MSRCHVCSGLEEGGVLFDTANDRDYPLCPVCFTKLSYHLLNMLNEHLNKLASPPPPPDQSMDPGKGGYMKEKKKSKKKVP